MAAIIEDSAVGTNILDTGNPHGLGALGFPTTVAGQTAFSIIGMGMIVTGITVIVAVGGLITVKVLQKRKELKAGKSPKKKKSTADQKFVLSLLTGAALLISVGSAMLPRTRTMMVLHITAGFICIALTLAHIYTYRKVLKAHTRKFWKFLTSKSDQKPTAMTNKKAQPQQQP